MPTRLTPGAPKLSSPNMKQFLFSLINRIPHITIPKPDGKPYLTRYYLFGADREWGNWWLHHFHSSDLDIAPYAIPSSTNYLLHCHPFIGSVSFVLTGGYNEERRNVDDTVYKRTVKPFSFNFLFRNDFHRVELLDEEKGAWTFFFTGPRSKDMSWGFWDRITKRYMDYKLFSKAIK
jgi:hypothetical protein